MFLALSALLLLGLEFIQEFPETSRQAHTVHSVLSVAPLPPALTEELESVTNELHAIDIQIQELTERQQELLQKKSVLTKKIKQCLEGSDAAAANSDCDSSPAAWNKEGLLVLCFPIALI